MTPRRPQAKSKLKTNRTSRTNQPRKAAGKAKRPAKRTAPKDERVMLLKGGNPRIARADGDAPVQAYIAGMPGWKRDVGRPDMRYLDIHEGDELDEAQLVAWVKQAAALPGWDR